MSIYTYVCLYIPIYVYICICILKFMVIIGKTMFRSYLSIEIKALLLDLQLVYPRLG